MKKKTNPSETSVINYHPVYVTKIQLVTSMTLQRWPFETMTFSRTTSILHKTFYEHIQCWADKFQQCQKLPFLPSSPHSDLSCFYTCIKKNINALTNIPIEYQLCYSYEIISWCIGNAYFKYFWTILETARTRGTPLTRPSHYVFIQRHRK